MNTRITDLLGIEYPIIQGGMHTSVWLSSPPRSRTQAVSAS